MAAEGSRVNARNAGQQVRATSPYVLRGLYQETLVSTQSYGICASRICLRLQTACQLCLVPQGGGSFHTAAGAGGSTQYSSGVARAAS
jgi:hypothetical protein